MDLFQNKFLLIASTVRAGAQEMPYKIGPEIHPPSSLLFHRWWPRANASDTGAKNPAVGAYGIIYPKK